MEICTEFSHEDPPNFDCDLIDQLGDLLTHQDDHVFERTISELLPEVTVMDNRSNSMLINFDFQTGTVLIAVDCSFLLILLLF